MSKLCKGEGKGEGEGEGDGDGDGDGEGGYRCEWRRIHQIKTRLLN